MKTYKKFAILFLISMLGLFVILSITTDNWKFLLWSLPPIFISFMVTFTSKGKKTIK